MRGTGGSSEQDYCWLAVPDWQMRAAGDDDIDAELDDDLGDDADFDEDDLEDDELDEDELDDLDDDLIDLDDEYDSVEEEDRHAPGPPRRYDE